MFLRLFLLFTLVPIIELILLIKLGQMHGWALTIAIILITGVVGTALVRRQGLLVMLRIREETSQGKPPTDSLMDGAMILIAGALLITPGVLTDVVGFLLLWSPFQGLMRKAVRQTILKNSKVQFHQHFQQSGSSPFESPFTQPPPEEPARRVDEAGREIIDVEFTRKEEQ